MRVGEVCFLNISPEPSSRTISEIRLAIMHMPLIRCLNPVAVHGQKLCQTQPLQSDDIFTTIFMRPVLSFVTIAFDVGFRKVCSVEARNGLLFLHRPPC